MLYYFLFLKLASCVVQFLDKDSILTEPVSVTAFTALDHFENSFLILIIDLRFVLKSHSSLTSRMQPINISIILYIKMDYEGSEM